MLTAEQPRILHIITRYHGGSGGNVLHSVEAAEGYGYAVRVLCGTDEVDPSYVERTRAAGVPVDFCPCLRRNVKPLDDLACVNWVRRYLSRHRFDLVHTHGSKAGVIGRLASRLAGVPRVVHTFHALSFNGYMTPAGRVAALLIERIARRWADYYVSVGHTLAEQAVRAGIVPADRIRTIYTAVDMDVFRKADVDPEEKKRALGLPYRRVVGSVGRLTRQKGYRYFVEAARLIAAERPEVGFALVGSGELAADIAEQVREAGLSGRFVMLGERADVAEVLRIFDVFVVSSLWEGFGRALTEALAVECPVVATAVNSIPDFIRDGQTGRLVPPAEAPALVRGILASLDDPEGARRMAEAARNLVEHDFRPEPTREKLFALYGELLDGHGEPA